MTNGELNILIVAEDGPVAAEIAKELLLDMQVDVAIVSTLDEARTIVTESNFDVILTADALSDGEGVLLAADADATAPVIVFLNQAADTEQALDLIRRGAADVLPHPLDMNCLIDSARRVGSNHKIARTSARRSSFSSDCASSRVPGSGATLPRRRPRNSPVLRCAATARR